MFAHPREALTLGAASRFSRRKEVRMLSRVGSALKKFVSPISSVTPASAKTGSHTETDQQPTREKALELSGFIKFESQSDEQKQQQKKKQKQPKETELAKDLESAGSNVIPISPSVSLEQTSSTPKPPVPQASNQPGMTSTFLAFFNMFQRRKEYFIRWLGVRNYQDSTRRTKKLSKHSKGTMLDRKAE